MPMMSAVRSIVSTISNMNGRIIIPNNAPKPGPAFSAKAMDKISSAKAKIAI